MRQGEKETCDILYENGYRHALKFGDDARTFDIFTGPKGPIVLHSYRQNGEDGCHIYVPVSTSNNSEEETKALLDFIQL